MSDPVAIINQFIADEDQAFAEVRQGKFWTMNHKSIKSALPKIGKVSDAVIRQKLYFHYMRRTGGVFVGPEADLPLLVAAYRDLLPVIDNSRVNALGRLTGLFLFGFDENGVVDDGDLTVDAVKHRLALMVQIGKYSNLPSQRKGQAKLENYVGDAPRILQTLRHLGYMHDRRYMDKLDLYHYVSLDFWGLILIALMNAETRTDILDDMMTATHLPKIVQQLIILNQTADSVMSRVSDDEVMFLELKQKLADTVAAF